MAITPQTVVSPANHHRGETRFITKFEGTTSYIAEFHKRRKEEGWRRVFQLAKRKAKR
jgi:hypothetical protein